MTVAGEARLSAGIIEDFHCLHSPVIGCQDYTHLPFYHNHKYIKRETEKRKEREKGHTHLRRKDEKSIGMFTYMNDVPLLVHHDVAVVSVLDLQQEPQHRVGCHRRDKVPE